jgi:hypothetical protein
MALITNNISGSSSDGWKVGITGSVLIGNPGARPFPSMPGNDVSFFVSGSIGGKGTADTAVFGGDTVVSGSLTVGTGSITITSNEIQFLGGIAKIYSGSAGLTFSDSTGTKTLASLSTGGGGGSSVFTEASATAAYTTSSIAIGYAGAASGKGSDVFLFVSGASDNTKTALFGGNVVTSGSVTIKAADSVTTSISSNGTGETFVNSTNNVIIVPAAGNVEIRSDLQVNGNVVSDANEAKSIFATVTSNDITIGGAGSRTVVSNLTASGSITGSIQKTVGGQDFIKAGPNITANYNTLGQWEITGAAGSGGSSVFTEASATAAYTTSSIAIGQASVASSIGSNLFFYVSGSKTSGGRPTSGVAAFGGDLAVTGTIYLGDGSVAGIYNRDGGALLYSTSPTSVVLGQDVILNTNVIKANDAQTAITLTSTNVAVAGDLTVTGNDISGSAGLNLTLGAGGNVTTAGDLTVTGNDISGSAGLNLTLGSSGDVTVAGDLTVAGNDIKSSTATALSLAGTTVTAQGNLIVKGDLYISGTTTTIDSTVVEIQDPVIGLGFASGSVAAAAGDRGFIGGISGAGNNVALVWSNNSGSFVATRTTTVPGASPVVVSNLLPVRVSRLDVNGTSAYITSSDAQTLELNGASGKGTKFTIGSSTEFAQFVDNGANAQFGALSGKQLSLSGSQVNLNAGNNGTLFQLNGTTFGSIAGNSTTVILGAAVGVTTANIVNSNATTVNFAGGAATVNIGSGSGRTTVNNDLAIATGNIIGAPGSGANVMTLISSGNIVAKLDIDNNGAGHQFQIQDYQGITQFLVGENGNAELSGTLVVSGTTLSTVSSNFSLINNTANSINFAGAATTLNIANSATNAQTINLATASTGSSTYNLATGATANAATKVVNLGTGGVAGSTTNINIGSALGSGTTVVTGSFQNKGNTTLGDTTANTITFTGRAASSLLPSADVSYDLGSAALRWRNMYTGDLHLRNERGDWTIIEEAEYLSITNNLSGKRYKFVLEEI